MGQSTAKSVVLKFMERLGVKFIGLAISIILARLLSPDVFGSLALINVFINLAQVFVQSGLNTALIQKKSITEDDYSTVMIVSIGVSVLLYMILWFSAPMIANYYQMEELVMSLRVLSLTLIVGAINSVQIAKLSREMRFDKIFIYGVSSTLVSGTIGIIFAYLNFGIWSLVIYTLSQQISVTVIILIAERWMPKFGFSKKSFKYTFSYGWKIMVSKLMYSIYTECRTLAIGKLYSSEQLAFYDKGNQFPNIISYNLDQAIGSVMLPRIAKEQDDLEKIRFYTSKAVKLSSYIVLPLMIGLVAVSHNFIIVILTEKWIASVPYIVIFCVAYMFLPISSINCTTIMAIGRTDILIKTQAIRICTMVILLISSIILFNNPFAIAVSYSIGMFLEALINIWPVKKYIGYTYTKQFKDIIPSFVISVIMGILVYCMNFLSINRMILLMLQIVIGGIIFWMLSFITKNESYLYISSFVKSVLKRR